MSFVDSTESRENRKNPVAKCYPHCEVNPARLTLLSHMPLSELIPLFAGSLNPLDPYSHALLIPKNSELAQIVARKQ